MKGILNYRIHFIDGSMKYVTSEEASVVEKAWVEKYPAVRVRGNSYACHQITKIVRDRQMEIDQLYDRGIVIDPKYLGYDEKKAIEFKQSRGHLLDIGGESNAPRLVNTEIKQIK